VSESISAPSSPHVTGTTPQDRENLASSYIPPADFVHSQNPASAQVYLGPESSDVPVPFLYNLDFNGQDFFPLTNNVNPRQSESYGTGRNDHFLPSSSSTGRLSGMEHNVGSYQQWLPEEANTQITPPSLLPYYSSTFPDNSDDIYAEIASFPHLSMMDSDDGTGSAFPFQTFDANNFFM
jgi:hypothetical protein